MDYKVTVLDNDQNKTLETVVKVRKDATIKRVALKAVEQTVDNLSSDPLEFMREVNYLFRESYDDEDFLEQLKTDLDLVVTCEVTSK